MTDKEIIERWLKGRLADLYEESQCELPELPKEVIEGKMLALRETLSFINTFEVKEVDNEPECKIFPRPIECYSNCKECPWLATNNKAQKGEDV